MIATGQAWSFWIEGKYGSGVIVWNMRFTQNP